MSSLYGDIPVSTRGIVAPLGGVMIPNVGLRAASINAGTNGRAHFIYLGQKIGTGVIPYVGLVLHSAVGTGITAESGIVTSPLAPRRATGQVLTKVWAATMTSLESASGTYKVNATAATALVLDGSHCWLAFYQAWSGSGATYNNYSRTWGLGDVLYQDGTALSAASTFTGTIVGATDVVPELFASES